MSVPALSDLERLPSIRFPSGNNIVFWMDFSFWKGIPSDRDFYITGDEEHLQSFYLSARGYGVRGDYGNGSISVKKSDIVALSAPQKDQP